MNNIKQKYFVYVGNAYPHKNLDRLIKAIVQLNKSLGENEKVVLKIRSGRGIFKDRVLKMISENNASFFVEYLDFISDNELKKLYKNSIAFVFPTLDEGFGLPPMEAIKTGTLAIVSDIPVLREIYQDSVSYFDPMDINSIVNELKKVMKLSLSKRKRRIDYAQKFIKRYSWKKMAEETLRLYENVVK